MLPTKQWCANHVHMEDIQPVVPKNLFSRKQQTKRSPLGALSRASSWNQVRSGFCQWQRDSAATEKKSHPSLDSLGRCFQKTAFCYVAAKEMLTWYLICKVS